MLRPLSPVGREAEKQAHVPSAKKRNKKKREETLYPSHGDTLEPNVCVQSSRTIGQRARWSSEVDDHVDVKTKATQA